MYLIVIIYQSYLTGRKLNVFLNETHLYLNYLILVGFHYLHIKRVISMKTYLLDLRLKLDLERSAPCAIENPAAVCNGSMPSFQNNADFIDWHLVDVLC